MIDVLELAHQRRAVLLREVETLNWFIGMARQLAEGSATAEPLVNRVSLDTGTQRAPGTEKTADVSDTTAPSAAPTADTVASATAPQRSDPAKAQRMTPSAQSPIDSLGFKRMLTEMRRKHQERASTDREKVAATA